MKTAFSITDAKEDLKALNDYLKELGEGIQNRTAEFAELEKLFKNAEFLRLMENVRFFIIDGNKHMAEVYSNLAKMYTGESEKLN